MSASSADIAYFYIALPSEKFRRRVYDSKDQLWALCLMLGLETVHIVLYTNFFQA